MIVSKIVGMNFVIFKKNYLIILIFLDNLNFKNLI